MPRKERESACAAPPDAAQPLCFAKANSPEAPSPRARAPPQTRARAAANARANAPAEAEAATRAAAAALQYAIAARRDRLPSAYPRARG